MENMVHSFFGSSVDRRRVGRKKKTPAGACAGGGGKQLVRNPLQRQGVLYDAYYDDYD